MNKFHCTVRTLAQPAKLAPHRHHGARLYLIQTVDDNLHSHSLRTELTYFYWTKLCISIWIIYWKYFCCYLIAIVFMITFSVVPQLLLVYAATPCGQDRGIYFIDFMGNLWEAGILQVNAMQLFNLNTSSFDGQSSQRPDITAVHSRIHCTLRYSFIKMGKSASAFYEICEYAVEIFMNWMDATRNGTTPSDRLSTWKFHTFV